MTNRSGPKTCVECVSCEQRKPSYNPTAPTIHMCTRTVDIVTGKTKPEACATVRKNERLCGHVGKWWKAKEMAEAAE